MYGLDLFTGIGGLTLALSEWVQPIAYCEIEPYCQSVLLSRMQEGLLPKAPIWDDIRTLRDALFDSGLIYTEVDIIYGGFRCTDISIAGVGKGLEGEQSGLFFEMLRIAQEISPRWLFLENVPAINKRGGLQIVRLITSLGYDCRWTTISASALGAPHKRERWFLLAHSNSARDEGLPSRKKEGLPESGMCVKHQAWDAWPEDESPLLGVDDGIPSRMDRAKSLGNAVVPIQAKTAFEILMGYTVKKGDY